MPHIIETIRNTSLSKAIEHLEEAHDLIVSKAIESQASLSNQKNGWGSRLKRLEIELPIGVGLIGKPKEKLVEIINILATTERTISALKWFKQKHPTYLVRECHASTSDEKGGNDIVLLDPETLEIRVRCEITDVTSSSAGQNGKEKKDLKNLGCAEEVPDDDIDRYIATSREFALALSSPKRKWSGLHYRYVVHETGFHDQTMMIEIVSPRLAFLCIT